MGDETIDSLSNLASNITDSDPNEFDLTVATLLVGLGAEKYISIFRDNNIGQSTLTELSLEDLEKMGVDDEAVRNKIITEVKSLPLYEENMNTFNKYKADHLDLEEAVEILSNTAQHIHHIELSFIANKIALKKTKNTQDVILHNELYASDIALKTLDSISDVIKSMQQILDSDPEIILKRQKRRRKKMVVSLAGGSVVATLAVLFYKSLKNL